MADKYTTSFMGGGISRANGYTIVNHSPVDRRFVVNDLTVLQSIVYTYEGLEVYVVSTKSKYRCLKEHFGGTPLEFWKEVDSPESGLTFKGTWNAKTNVPNLNDMMGVRSTLNNGDYFKVSDAYSSERIAKNGLVIPDTDPEYTGPGSTYPVVSNVTVDDNALWGPGDWVIMVNNVDEQGNTVSRFERIGNSGEVAGGTDEATVKNLIRANAVVKWEDSKFYTAGQVVYHEYEVVVTPAVYTGAGVLVTPDVKTTVVDMYYALGRSNLGDLSSVGFDKHNNPTWKLIGTTSYDSLKLKLIINNNAGVLANVPNDAKVTGKKALLDADEIDRRIMARPLPNLDGGNAKTTPAGVGAIPGDNQFPS